MMKRLILVTALLAAVSACKEEEAGSGDTETSEQATGTESGSAASGVEDSATADDGGGAMAGAEDTATADDGGGAMAGTDTTGVMASDVSQDAIDGCIDALMSMQGGGGTVMSTEFSEANSLVMLEDSNGGTWRCLVSNDGSNASVEAVDEGATADDGGGAMDGATSDAGLPAAGSATDLTDFVGARAGQAEGGLQALGFEAIRSEGLVTFWFNRETGACARITTSDGVYSEVVMLPAEDC